MSFFAVIKSQCRRIGASMSIFYQSRLEALRFYTSENNSFTAHLHCQVELIAVLAGALTATIDHREYHLSAGSVAIIFPNQLHSLETPESSRILLCIFDGDYCHSYQKYFWKCNPKSNVLMPSELSSHGHAAIDGLLGLTGAFPRGGNIPRQILALAEGYLTLLLADIFPKLTLSPKNISADLVLEQRLLLYIDAHFTENLSLEILSREFGVSRFSLSRLFSDKFRTTFPCYVNSKRLEFARDMLISTNESITRIALDAGFGSSRTFFREFQQAFHMTPKEYRQNHTLNLSFSPAPKEPLLPPGHVSDR